MEEELWPNGNIKSREYFNDNGQLHNEQGPAVVSWYKNGQLCYQEYYINDQLHNEQGPAVKVWYENGKLEWQEYYINDQQHNEQGPALERWYENGQLWVQEYWIEGNKVTETELKSMIPSVKSASKS